jgi:hypothetical protein
LNQLNKSLVENEEVDQSEDYEYGSNCEWNSDHCIKGSICECKVLVGGYMLVVIEVQEEFWGMSTINWSDWAKFVKRKCCLIGVLLSF